MTPELFIAVASGILSLGIVGYAIWRWGPGLRKHSVGCPVAKRSAKVVAKQQESEFGSLKMADITDCSLLGGQPVTCGKDCLKRL